MMNRLMQYLRWIVHETRELYGRRELLLLAVLASVALLSGSAYAQEQGTDRD